MPPFGVVNNDAYDKYKDSNSQPIVYAMNSVRVETKNSKMIQHIMKIFNELDISLLKPTHDGMKEYRIKHKLSLKDIDDNVELEIPYILTDNLCDELMNLEYVPSGAEGKVTQVSMRIPKDKFSALMYGLYWIKMYEDENRITDSEYAFGCFD